MPSIALQFPSGRGTRGGGFLQFARRAARLADLVVALKRAKAPRRITSFRCCRMRSCASAA
jgi:hypothetical protein